MDQRGRPGRQALKIEWRSHEHMVSMCRAHAQKVRALNPDVIIGIPRSGMIPATHLATTLGLPLADLHSFCAGRMWNISDDKAASALKGRRVLIVDDASAYRAAMPRAVEMVQKAVPGADVLKCAVYVTPGAVSEFDVAMDVCPKPRLFEWNWWRSGKLLYCCLDIDGVICLDPTRDQKRDPEQYRHFLGNASPLYLPRKGVGALVTGRSAAFRTETEDWMRRNGVKFQKMHMFDGPSPRDKEKHSRSKADFYRKSDYGLFLESNDKQAAMISEMSGKDVVCIGSMKLYRGGLPC